MRISWTEKAKGLKEEEAICTQLEQPFLNRGRWTASPLISNLKSHLDIHSKAARLPHCHSDHSCMAVM